MRDWLVLLLLIICPHGAYASDIEHAWQFKRTYTAKEGLSQSTVYDIEQDLNGYIWLATQSGLDRFDGYSFVNFGQSTQTENGLSGTRILDIELDHITGDLWIATASGLNVFDAKSGLIREIYVYASDGSQHQRFNALHFDKKGALWFDADGKLFTKERDQSKFLQVTLPVSEGKVDIVEIDSDQGNTIYLASSRGVLRFDTVSRMWLAPLVMSASILSVFIDEKQALWAGSHGQGIYYFVFDKDKNVIEKQTVGIDQGLADMIVNDIGQTKEGDVLAVTNSGMSVFSDIRGDNILRPNTLSASDKSSESIMYSVFITASDDIIYGTLVNGFSIVSPNSLLFSTLAIPDQQLAYSSTLDRHENLWVAAPEGVYKVSADLASSERVNFAKGDKNYGSSNIIVGVSYSGHTDTIWVASRAGLARVNENRNEISLVSFHGVPIYTVDYDSEGNLYVGTYNDGFYHYNPLTNEVIAHYKTGRVLGIYPSSESLVWLATTTGLVRINPIERTQAAYINQAGKSDTLGHNVVTWVSRKSADQYFVGTQSKGLYLMTYNPLNQEVKFETLFADSLLSQLSIGAVKRDIYGDYWVSTIKGIAKLSADLLNITFYDQTDGTSANGYFIGASPMSLDGRLFFSGAGGITHFHPDEIARPSSMPPLHINLIDILNEDAGKRIIDAKSNALYPLKDTDLTLENADIVVMFELAALELVSPDKISYFYRLKGFSDQWQNVDSAKRSITYTSLAPGDYTLEVKSTNRYGQWNEDIIAMKIHVLPAWYLSSWAIGCWSLMVLLFIYLYASWRSYSHYYRAQELAQEVANKTKDLALANEQLRVLSNIDPLTKIYNRRGFTAEATQQLSVFKERQTSFSLLLFDIDYFKNINDSYGHAAGDEVLIAVTIILQATLGHDAILGRWGGEEFIALLPNSTLASSTELANKALTEIAHTSMPVGGETIKVTVSGGLSVIQSSESIDNCIKRADILMYQAKQNGRNQICHLR